MQAKQAYAGTLFMIGDDAMGMFMLHRSRPRTVMYVQLALFWSDGKNDIMTVTLARVHVHL
jgi:hypothetical protein